VPQRIILRFIFSNSAVSGRRIAAHLRLRWQQPEPLLKHLRQEKNIDLPGTTAKGDSEFILTPIGRERARQYLVESSYFGVAPVPLEDYASAVAMQSPSRLQINMADLRRDFRGLVLSDQILERLGPAIKARRGLCLCGNSGNGKTRMTERTSKPSVQPSGFHDPLPLKATSSAFLTRESTHRQMTALPAKACSTYRISTAAGFASNAPPSSPAGN